MIEIKQNITGIYNDFKGYYKTNGYRSNCIQGTFTSIGLTIFATISNKKSTYECIDYDDEIDESFTYSSYTKTNRNVLEVYKIEFGI